MNNQTARRTDKQRPTRSAQTKTYTRQTAHVEARRDGQPLIFGWGGHLTRTQKTQLQRLGIWSFIGLIILLVIVVFVGYWINLNVIIPNQPIASVDGKSIPQSDYHKLVALQGQIAENQIKGKNGLRAQADTAHTQSTTQQKTIDDAKKSVDDLTKQIKALPANSSQRPDLQKQLDAAKTKQTDAEKQKQTTDTLYNNLNQQETLQESLFTQSQIGTTSAQWLQEDLVISKWLGTQSTALQNQINPTSSAVTKALNDLKASLPKGKSYDKFLSDSNVSDGDMQTMMTLKLRRDNTQNYLASQITTPSRQVNARAITVATENDANAILKQLKAGGDFHKIATQKSLDNNTKAKGGELGWLADGQYMLDYGSNIGATVDNWLMNPARQNNEFSPVLKENGTFHVLQFEGSDASRAISADELKKLKDNALKHWIENQKVKGVKFGEPDSAKLFDASIMPSWIPASPPNQQTPGAPGSAPGGVPGGAPSSGVPG